MLNTTIEGGATKDSAGVWRNANGQPLDDAQIAKAERLAAEQQQQVQQAAQQQEAQALMRNPGALALALQLQGIPQPAPTQDDDKSTKDGKK